MVSNRFENKTTGMSTQELAALQSKLSERVENNKLGIGQRLGNFAKAGIASAAVSELADLAVSGKNDYMLGGGTLTTIFAPFDMTKDAFRGRFDKEVAIIAAAGITTLIGGLVFANKRSKAKQEDKLSFVEQEMARRDQATLSHHPIR